MGDRRHRRTLFTGGHYIFLRERPETPSLLD
jgi:hypothetical protein